MKTTFTCFIFSFLCFMILSIGHNQNFQSEVEIISLTANEAANLIATGQLSSETLTAELLEQVEQNTHLNIFITVNKPSVLLAARAADEAVQTGKALGPLHGVPIVIKNNIAVAGLPNTIGLPALLKHVPNEDAAVIRVLLDAGAIILGTTNMYELGLGIASDNSAFGTVTNPYNPITLAGDGSSAAIAARMAPIGLGTDGNGSLRISASLNGVVGFRPTVGSYPLAGVVINSNTRDTVGIVARSVNDIVLLDGVIRGENEALEPANLEGLRIGIAQKLFYDNLDKDTERLTAPALTKIIEAGVEIIEADIENISALNEAIRPLAKYEALELFSDYLTKATPQMKVDEALIQLMPSTLTIEGNVNKETYEEIIDKHRPALQKAYKEYFEEIEAEAIIFPTTPLPARLIKDGLETVELNRRQVPTFIVYTQNTEPASNAGLPALTLPIGLTPEGLPVGIEIDGPQGSDKRLLQIGLALEKVLGELPAPNLP